MADKHHDMDDIFVPLDATASNMTEFTNICKRGILEEITEFVDRYDASAMSDFQSVVTWDICHYHTPQEKATVIENVFSISCQNGWLGIIQYLTKRFGLIAQNIRLGNSFVLQLACEAGHFNIVKFLVEYFDLTISDISSDDFDILRRVCSNGHLEILEYLIDHLNLTAECIRDNDNYILCVACDAGQEEIAQFLIDKFDMTDVDKQDVIMYHGGYDNHIGSTSCESLRIMVLANNLHWHGADDSLGMKSAVKLR